MAKFKLDWRERRVIKQILVSTNDAVILRRAQALTWLDNGESAQEIASRLKVSRQVIYQWVTIFQERSDLPLTTRLACGVRSGRPCKLKGVIDPLIDAVIDREPEAFGLNSTVWTAPLLVAYLRNAHNLMVSVQSVRLAISRLEIRWKRPRHDLALRSKTWRQAKGGLKRGSQDVNGRLS